MLKKAVLTAMVFILAGVSFAGSDNCNPEDCTKEECTCQGTVEECAGDCCECEAEGCENGCTCDEQCECDCENCGSEEEAVEAVEESHCGGGGGCHQ